MTVPAIENVLLRMNLSGHFSLHHQTLSDAMLLFRQFLLTALALVAIPLCSSQPLPQLTSIVEDPPPYDPIIAESGMMMPQCDLMPGIHKNIGMPRLFACLEPFTHTIPPFCCCRLL